MRGLAYFRMRLQGEAAAEFQKTLDHPELVLNDPIGPMRVSNWRERCASGDHARSAATYQELLTLWNDADRDIPAVREERPE